MGVTLVLDGALYPPSAVLLDRGAVVVSSTAPEGESGRGDLLGAIGRLIPDPRQLDELVVGTGPGSFTGMRVAMGLALGLARAPHRPTLFAADTALALWSAAGLGARQATVVIPWGRLRALLVQVGPEGTDDKSAQLVANDRLQERRELNAGFVVLARGAEKFDYPPRVERVPIDRSLAECLAQLHGGGGTTRVEPERLRPSYLVPPDAVRPLERTPGLGAQELRRLVPSDLAQLVELERAAFSSPWSEAMLAQELEPMPGRDAWGLFSPQGRLLGLLMARIDFDIYSILNVAVHPDARRRGLARLLVRTGIARALEERQARVDLEVEDSNGAAIALYAGEGFVPVGLRRGYYPGGGDALLMSLMLPAGKSG